MGTVGTWIFGLVALLWTLDCFVGAWLTFPPPRRRDARHRPRRFWTRWAKAWQIRWRAGGQHLEVLAQNRDLTIHALERFAYTPHKNALKLMARTSSDVNERFGETWVYVDATDGALLGHYLPTGEAAGNTVTTWLTSLHIAAVGGVGYRVIATVLGLAVILLSITGVLIWWRKRGHRIY